jgi:hypothetical protein
VAPRHIDPVKCESYLSLKMALTFCLRTIETVAVMSKQIDGPTTTSIFSDNLLVVHNVLHVSTFSAKLYQAQT